ncbi:DUF1003 domain-containing protein [Fimbriimonas ginsengisoli]|uniref:Membrane protein n=1 Tax=Fimbriimonas ginsengisoli Gsoil 348 TaxID=661478 RepID=A0A068NJS9_FIMGI|nr:DUF1003 domain-containing protein [Fimbriimonas ginsengisoli]AIE83707.1 membrane protein [Fimbriimonas ginsengisoli Gsoil 348]
MPNDTDSAQGSPDLTTDVWSSLRLPASERAERLVKNANDVQGQQLSALDRLAVVITDQVGTMGFFLTIFAWTVLWCGYNILASRVPSLHWKAFDPFPAFVSYLLICNVIQILLIPLIMVGQNLQGRHAEIRAQLDFEINQTAEKEVTMILRHLEHQTDLIIQLMKHQNCQVSPEVVRSLRTDQQLTKEIEKEKPT